MVKSIYHTHELLTDNEQHGIMSHEHEVDTNSPPHAHILSCGQAYVDTPQPLGATGQ